jgi:peptidoglycan LD-endopeptidase CwlK
LLIFKNFLIKISYRKKGHSRSDQMAHVDQDLDHLHTVLRGKVQVLLNKLSEEGIPFLVFEGFRTPQRQNSLYAQGRTTGGNKVTNAEAWESYHQYGLAADFVIYQNNKWSWDTSDGRSRWWDRLDELGKELGLEGLGWEKPHLQLAGLNLSSLKAGKYPPGGDSLWAENLAQIIYSWTGSPAAPPVPDVLPDKPTID